VSIITKEEEGLGATLRPGRGVDAQKNCGKEKVMGKEGIGDTTRGKSGKE